MDVESLGSEVSTKVRSAIKAKLIELGSYVDDELPDYIMVMVANKKTLQQTEEDLKLFLNDRSAAFSQWLHGVLSKLQKVTLGGECTGKTKAVKSKKNKVKKVKVDSKKVIKGTTKHLKVDKSKAASVVKKSKSSKVEKDDIGKEQRPLSVSPLQTAELDKKSLENSALKSTTGDKLARRSSAPRTTTTTMTTTTPPPPSRPSRTSAHPRSPSVERHSKSRRYSPRRYSSPPLSSRRQHKRMRHHYDDESDKEAYRPSAYDRGPRGYRELEGDRRAPPRLEVKPGGGRRERSRHDRRISHSSLTSPPPGRHSNKEPKKPPVEEETAAITVSSSVGAVISHKSDGEYNPEQILKKSLVTSQVSVTPRPATPKNRDAGRSLVMKAANDANNSIYKREAEIRQKDAELNEIHKKRMRLTEAKRHGHLDWHKVQEINKKGGCDAIRGNRSGRDVHGNRQKTLENQIKPWNRKCESDVGIGKSVAADGDAYNKKDEGYRRPCLKVTRTFDESKSSGYLPDLRQRLTEKKKRKNRTREGSPVSKATPDTTSPLPIQSQRILGDKKSCNEQITQNASSVVKSSPVESRRAHRSSKKSSSGGSHDEDLVEMRQNALKTMKRWQKDTPPCDPIFEEERRIMIRHHNSRDDDVPEIELHAQESQDDDSGSSSSSSNSSSSDDSSEQNDNESSEEEDVSSGEISLSSENEDDNNRRRVVQSSAKNKKVKGGDKRKDPTFIVTLTGISSTYFKKEDTECKGGLKLRKNQQPPTTVYVKSDKTAQDIKALVGQVTAQHQHQKLSSSPGGSKKEDDPRGEKCEKPKALVAPIRNDKTPTKTPQTHSVLKGASSSSKGTHVSSFLPSKQSSTSTSSRKRILPPENNTPSPTGRHSNSKLLTNVCRYWPNCTYGSSCRFFHPKGNSSMLEHPSVPQKDKFRWTSASVLP